MADELNPILDEKAESNIAEEKIVNILAKEFELFKAVIQGHLDKQVELNRFKDETIDRLQKTVNEYEKGFIEKIREPLLMDIIFFKDSFEKFKATFEESADFLVKEINMLDEELDEVLYANVIKLIDTDSDFYNRDFQVVKIKTPTENIQDDKRIAKVLKKGYMTENKILRKEEIVVWIFEKTPE